MANKVAERLLWAVEMLDIQPDDHVLEIGCGHGVAVSLICENLITGKITAIDRSAKMIDMARKRNSDCYASGKGAFHITSLDQADFGVETFNKIFAFHVNVFLRKPEKELRVVQNALAASGLLYLFYQPLTPDKVPQVVAQLNSVLPAYGFSINDTIYGHLETGTTLCVMAALS